MVDKKTARLLELAIEARKNSYSPYSNFPIGAALLCKNGEIYTGTNVENVSYGLTNCAERTAIFKAVSEGVREFDTMVVVADTERPIPPCGACRQVILEFGEDIQLVLANLKGDYQEYQIKDLLPGAFNRKDMEYDI
ncbi:MAG: cytidine deaminase [Halanaerobiaceae bacterium]|nr:cytidine deaminase [Halanaerobiaceae bacterium]